MKESVLSYMDGKYTLRDVYNQIKDKTCPLTFSQREYVLSLFWSDGTFVYNNTDHFN